MINKSASLPTVVGDTQINAHDRPSCLNEHPSNDVPDLCMLEDICTKLDADERLDAHTQSIHPTLCPYTLTSWVSNITVVLPGGVNVSMVKYCCEIYDNIPVSIFAQLHNHDK